jgi:hypothetical protein
MATSRSVSGFTFAILIADRFRVDDVLINRRELVPITSCVYGRAARITLFARVELSVAADIQEFRIRRAAEIISVVEKRAQCQHRETGSDKECNQLEGPVDL